MDSKEKARATREARYEVQRQLWTEQRTAIGAARVGLRRVMESAAATPEQILEAARLLAEISR